MDSCPSAGVAAAAGFALRVQPFDPREVQLDQLTRADLARGQQHTGARHTGKRRIVLSRRSLALAHQVV